MRLDRAQMDAVVSSMDSDSEYALRVTGNSMYPFLVDEVSVVWLKKGSAYRKGDILLYTCPDGRFMLHRLHRIEPGGALLMNGDAQVSLQRIRPGDVRARVVRYKRRRRESDPDSLRCRVAVACWRALRPVRPVIFKVGHFMKRVLTALRGR